MIADQIENLMLGLAPKGPVQPAWIDTAIDLLPKAANKIKRQRSALQSAKAYMEQQQNEWASNVLAIVNGVLDSDDYVP